ncbi:FAD-NAD(P)-binding [Mesonia phycicola]|uniref:FAD-NAD(P)-binding n=1 Tax=Mesonia phycicola TaxID=579105 RepID=A0A1M6BL60_9FLAO|nr:FAD/NAD(P)-binding protein [Mesonia phycicola]SHI49444.1 FAD-NAD(P)-binding [Mesonia phycicola]
MEKKIQNTFLTIAIIGFGPKGLFALERLIANLQSTKSKKRVHIHIYNRTSFFGSGDVYRTDQPDYLLMNYANYNISFKNKEIPHLQLPQLQEFLPWLTNKTNKTLEEIEYTYSSRKTVGEYLEYCLSMLLSNLPDNIRVTKHIATVVDIIPTKNEYQINTDKVEENSVVKEIMLTTGHFWNRHQIKPSTNSKKYIDFVYPVQEKLQHILNTETVAIKGIGLTFIDVVLALTEGRGGKFIKSNNTIKYIASGREPKVIYPYSRSGLPMIPRKGNTDKVTEFKFFTEDFVQQLLCKKSIDFQKDILPVIKKESLFIFYQTNFRNYNFDVELSDDLFPFKLQIEKFHQQYPEAQKFDCNFFINPFSNKETLSNKDILPYINFICDLVEENEETSPWLAVISSLRNMSVLFSKIYRFGGLSAMSHQKFDSQYFGLLNRLAYGPPVQNMRKIEALIKSKILDFSYARGSKIKENINGSFSIFNKKSTNYVDIHINATIPRAAKNQKRDGLFGKILNRGIISEFVNTNGTSYATGAVAINKKGQVIDNQGKINKHISCYGTPTEGITFDNDTLSNRKNNFSIYWAKHITEQLN